MRKVVQLCLVVSLGVAGLALMGPAATADRPGPGAEVSSISTAADLIKVNEIYSQGGDFIELTNIGSVPVDVSGWQLADDSAKRFRIPEDSTIPAGGFLSFLVDEGDNPLGGFGLGGGDAARVFLADGETQVDAHTYPGHAGAGRSWGRCPDGSGDFVVTAAITPGAANDCPGPEADDVRINEVESNGDAYDWVEVTNVGEAPVDISGWVVMDDGERGTAVTFPAGTVLAPGGYATVNTDDPAAPGSFGLGAADQARLFLPDATTLVDSVSWAAHSAITLGRCPDGTGDFTTTTAPSKGAVNVCAGILNPSAWPGGEEVQPVDVNGYFGSDLSGLAFQSGEPDVLWAVRNGDGFIFRLVQDGAEWKPATTEGWSNGKKLRYPDGGGTLDAEGIDVVDGAAYVATERDQSGASRPSILRYELGGATSELIATQEWNLKSDFPGIGANLGLEGIAFVPNSFLTEQGFYDEHRGAIYDPAAYPDQHGDGLFFVVVEDSSTQGTVFGYSLDEDGSFVQVASIDNALGAAMELEFEADAERLWVICDDGCNGRTLTLEIDQTAGETRGRFVGTAVHERPTGLPNSNHEGFAIAPTTRCVDGRKQVLWSDDNNLAGHALRAGTIDCAGEHPARADATVTASAPAAVETGASIPVAVTVTSDHDQVPTGEVTLTVEDRTVSGVLDAQGHVRLEAGPLHVAGLRTIAVAYGGDEHTRPSSTMVVVEVRTVVHSPEPVSPVSPPATVPWAGPTPGQIKIGKPRRAATKVRIGQRGARVKLKVRVAGKGTVGQLQSRRFKVRIKGIRGKVTARVNKAGRLVIRLPWIAKTTKLGKKTVRVRYRGEPVGKFTLRVIR